MCILCKTESDFHEMITRHLRLYEGCHCSLMCAYSIPNDGDLNSLSLTILLETFLNHQDTFSDSLFLCNVWSR